jgi:hypothetical protein
MDWLRDTLAPHFVEEMSKYLRDPWEARNDYIQVILNRATDNVEVFLSKHAREQLNEESKRRVIKLLEMQRHSMLMYTSCGWFFDEISGIESVQVMMYAARAMQLAADLFGLDLEKQYMEILQAAHSNLIEFKNGARVYSIFIKPAIVDFSKISAQNTMMQLFTENVPAGILTRKMPNCCFTVAVESVEKRDDGKFRLVINRSTVSSTTTLDRESFGCAAIWLGDHNVSCGAKLNMPMRSFHSMQSHLLGYFEKGQINEIIVLLSRYFGENNYSLKDMFKDDQLYILDYIVADGIKKAKELYDIVYHDNSAMLRFMKETRIPSPKPLQAAADIVLDMELQQLLSQPTSNLTELQKRIAELRNLSVTLDTDVLAFKASEKITDEFSKLAASPENLDTIKTISALISMVQQLPLKLNLWQAQNVAFKIAQNQYKQIKQQPDEGSKAWTTAFEQLCVLIGIRLG